MIEGSTGIILTAIIGWCGWVSITCVNSMITAATLSTKVDNLQASVVGVQTTLDLIAPRLGVNPMVRYNSTTTQ